MANLNKVLLMGNLTRDPQLRYLPSQTAVVEFGVACNRRWKTPQGEEREEVTFVDCSAFGKTAETINQYMQKGKPIFVEGRLKFDTWEDKQGGGKRSRLSVVVENFQFIGGRDGGASSAAPNSVDESSQAPPRRPALNRPAAAAPNAPAAPPISDEEHFKENEIPF